MAPDTGFFFFFAHLNELLRAFNLPNEHSFHKFFSKTLKEKKEKSLQRRISQKKVKDNNNNNQKKRVAVWKSAWPHRVIWSCGVCVWLFSKVHSLSPHPPHLPSFKKKKNLSNLCPSSPTAAPLHAYTHTLNHSLFYDICISIACNSQPPWVLSSLPSQLYLFIYLFRPFFTLTPNL